jgi:hypothetical protein
MTGTIQAWWQATRVMTSMMMTMPLQQGKQFQLEDGKDFITTRITTPSWIKDNDAIITRVTTPAWWWQGHLRIDNNNITVVMRVTIAIAMMAKTPAH